MRILRTITAFIRRLGITAIIILILLIAARAALPYVLERYVNRTLADLPGYRGELSSIDVNLWRGAYTINDLRIVKTDGRVPVPFFSGKEVDLSLQWKALLHGAVVGSARLKEPKLNFVAGKSEQDTQVSMEEGWREPLKRLFPVRFNEIRIQNGEIHFRDFYRTPQVDVYLNSVNARASNFTNSLGISKTLVAKVEGTPRAQDQSKLGIELDFDPFSKDINFKFKGQIEDLDLTRLNDLFLAYADFDFEAGTLSVYSELDAKQGGFKGYVKPLFRDIKNCLD